MFLSWLGQQACRLEQKVVLLRPRLNLPLKIINLRLQFTHLPRLDLPRPPDHLLSQLMVQQVSPGDCVLLFQFLSPLQSIGRLDSTAEAAAIIESLG